jgi:hypothetical protein
VDTPQPLSPAPAAWSAPQRHAFRFLAVYVLLYALPFPLEFIPGPSILAHFYVEAWNAVIPWVGSTILGIDYEIPLAPTGSGDTTAEYVKLFSVLVLATVGSTVWSLLDRRASHPRLAQWLVVYARYWLGSILIGYGFAKLFVLQFPAPDPFRLLEPYGESSPMGLVWAFMGQSPAYNVFTGGVEAVGGLLLFWRRTTTLGALVCAGAMANVVMLNYCYDVPVKLFSSHLLLAALALAALDGRRLLGMLLGRAVPAREVPPVLTGRRGRWVRRVGKSLFVAGLLVLQTVMSLQAVQERGSDAPKPPLYGIYEVTSHTRDGVEQAALSSDPPAWRHVTFGSYGRAALWPVHGECVRSKAEIDADAGTIVLTPREPGREPATLRFHAPEEGALVLEGLLDGTEQRLVLRRIDETAMRLPSRGFHWINETPYNR